MSLIGIRSADLSPDNLHQGANEKVMQIIQSLTMSQSSSLWAYLDPGTGSMVFQILVAGLLSSSFFLKSWMRSLRDGMRLKTRNS
jgi:hypothetical protein